MSELVVTAGEAGARLDLFLARHLGISRVEARRLLAAGQVRRDARPLALAHKGERVAAGQAFEIADFTPPPQRRPVPEPGLPLTVLAAGDGWVAVDKLPGMPVHPLRADETGTALNALVALHPEIVEVGERGLRGGVVHRLDVDTSGVVLFATREDAWRRLRALFASHRMRKTYRAVACGRLEEPGSVRLWLRVARGRPARVIAVAADGPPPIGAGSPADPARPAGAAPAGAAPAGEPPPGSRLCEMSWRPLAPLRGATLVEAHPVTGFLHQVRVTFAHLGHPLAGDRLYGSPADATGAARHMLHAARLAWDEAEVASPDPADFAALLLRLG